MTPLPSAPMAAAELPDVRDRAVGPGPYIADVEDCPLPAAGVESCSTCSLHDHCAKVRNDVPPAAASLAAQLAALRIHEEGDSSDEVADEEAVTADAVARAAAGAVAAPASRGDEAAGPVHWPLVDATIPDWSAAAGAEVRATAVFPLAEGDRARLLELEGERDAPGMEAVELSGGVTVSKKRIEGSNVFLGRASGVVDGSAGLVMRLLWDFTVRRRWDNWFVEQVVLEQVTPVKEHVYFTGKMPPFVGKRDFVQARQLWVSADHTLYLAVYKSEEHPRAPVRKGYIRGHVYFSGFVCRQVAPGKCRVTMVTHSDMKGRIPKFVINAMTTRVAPRWVAHLRKAAALFGPILARLPAQDPWDS